MNVFYVDKHPVRAAEQMCDKHIVKMPLETCQMLSMVYSKWYFDWGQLTKRDGTPYKTEKGAFRGHPCTAWAAENINNTNTSTSTMMGGMGMGGYGGGMMSPMMGMGMMSPYGMGYGGMGMMGGMMGRADANA